MRLRPSLWHKLTKRFRAFELESIRNKILLFAVLATAVPSGITAIVSYTQNRRALEQRINRELVSVGSQTAREMDVWLKERFQELRTFAASPEVSESLDRAAKGGSPNRGRLADYLKSVRGRLREYSELLVLDAAGQPFASTAPTITAARLPADWAKRLRAENHLVGDAYWDDAAQEAQLTVAIPIERIDGRLIGVLAAKVRLAGVQQQLQELAGGTDVRLFLATTDGKMIVGSSGSSSGLTSADVLL